MLSLVVWYLIQVDSGQEKQWLDVGEFDKGDGLEVRVLDPLVYTGKTCLGELFVLSHSCLDPGETASPLVSDITNSRALRMQKTKNTK